MSYRPFLRPGEPAPWFRAPAIGGSATYNFHTVAGRHALMLFLGSAEGAEAAAALALVAKHRIVFDDASAAFFGVVCDPADVAEERVAQSLPGIRYFLDESREVSRLFGAAGGEGEPYRPFWLVLDPTLRSLALLPLERGEEAIAALSSAAGRPRDQEWAPVLLVPNVFDRDLCRRLIALYEAEGGEPSGFMREVDGKTVVVTDPGHKLRCDCPVEDPALRRLLLERITSGLVPMVRRAFQFEATRMERYLIGCYDAGTGGHFRPHRDNTTKGTAHRRFAVSINLNAGDYDGGDLRFPEFGPRTYCPPTGGAVVFSCSLLHEATPMTRGTRYAFLPFLYDEAAARQREANNPHLAAGLGEYRA
ncbi:MAG: 2OG-Fe(II) oxygenase [Alphaproteobacteria bacterium]|nr:2OG-Fe(II) oxygenase [Alphaproteobacteria bacterium]